MRPKCQGCGGVVKRPVHPGNRGSIYCSSACRKGTYRDRWKGGLLAALESRFSSGEKYPHEWAFNRNQELYWCPKCGATIKLALVQHAPEMPWELFKGRCRGIPLVEMKTAVVAVAEKAEAEFIGEPKEPEIPGRVIKFDEEV